MRNPAVCLHVRASRRRSRLTQQSTFTASFKWAVDSPNGEPVSLLAQAYIHIHLQPSTRPVDFLFYLTLTPYNIQTHLRSIV